MSLNYTLGSLEKMAKWMTIGPVSHMKPRMMDQKLHKIVKSEGKSCINRERVALDHRYNLIDNKDPGMII